jgi:hypothetical protein
VECCVNKRAGRRNDKMKKNDNEVKLKKIPLKRFIDTLIDVYTSGADYIDLIGIADEEQDSIGISVSNEYMNVDREQYYEDLSEKIFERSKGKLSEEDFNELT